MREVSRLLIGRWDAIKKEGRRTWTHRKRENKDKTSKDDNKGI